jgi:hypothetical protein
MMNHKISDMCDLVNRMYEKSMNLRRLKYDTSPVDRKTPAMQREIQNLVDDIQAMALLIAHDKRGNV